MINKKMKNYLLSGIATLAMFGATMVICSCDTENDLDVTNPNQAALDANWLAKFGDIDDTQDWSLATTAKATMSVYGIDALSNYQLQLFTENPIYSDNALLMASKKVTTDASGNASVTFDSVDLIEGHTIFYACYMDKDYRKNVKPVAMINGIINAQFGEPASSTRASMNKASTTSDGVVIPTVTNPKDEVDAKYSSAIEVDANNTDSQKSNWTESPYFAPYMKISSSWNGNISVLGCNGALTRTLYVDGTWTLNGNQKLGAGGLIVVHSGGKIVIPSGSSLNTDNGGRIVVLSGGTIEGKGSITFCNGSGNSFDYNAGTIDIGVMNNNGGDVYNYGTMTIVELYGGSGNSRYINHSNNMTINNCTYGNNTANARILTDCKLEVTHDLCCRNIIMGNPSYIHIGGNLLMSSSWDSNNDSSEILMAANSYLKVDGGIALNNTSIVGPTSGFAVCEFGQIGDPNSKVATNYTQSWQNNRNEVTEGYVINNLYISIDKPGEENPNEYDAKNPYCEFIGVMKNGRGWDNYDSNGQPKYNGSTVGTGNAVIVEKGQANITIPAGDCVPGYNAAKGTPQTPEPQNFIFACEDLGSSDDLDFNDIVFSVGHISGSNYITISPLAAGGILPAYICYNGSEVGEIHKLLGVDDTTQMLNTTIKGITYDGTPKTISVDDKWTFADNINLFTIQVTGKGASNHITSPTQGTAPFMIVVPSNWQWPLEKVSIEKAYPNFKDWSQNAATNDSWTENRDDTKTVTR